MKKVILFRGLPGSGKTYHAKKLQETYPGQYKRVNKDDLRSMLDHSRYSKANEKFIKSVRDYLIVESLREGKTVLVDDTHLPLEPHYSQIKQTIREAGFDCPIEVEDSFLSVPYEECVKRDLQRLNSVGEGVIKKIYNKYLKESIKPPNYNPDLSNAIIIDIDGTVALMENRSPYEYEKCDTDSPNPPIVDLVRTLKRHNSPIPPSFIFMSGRESVCYEKTYQWLIKNVVVPDKLYMRQEGDHRKDWVVKKELYETYLKDRYNIEFILDDRKQVVDMWRSLGLTVLQVAEGDF